MIAVQFPEPVFRIRTAEGKRSIFDAIRKAWVPLTEEEWVRQNFVSFLTSTLNYPAALIAIEKEIQLHDLKKRFDILVYDKDLHPWMMIECKEPGVPLDEVVLQQVLRYNMSVPVPFLVLTNGRTTIGWEKKNGTLVLLEELPHW